MCAAPFSALNILVLKLDIWSKMSKNTIKVYIAKTIFFSEDGALPSISPRLSILSLLEYNNELFFWGPLFWISQMILPKCIFYIFVYSLLKDAWRGGMHNLFTCKHVTLGIVPCRDLSYRKTTEYSNTRFHKFFNALIDVRTCELFTYLLTFIQSSDESKLFVNIQFPSK